MIFISPILYTSDRQISTFQVKYGISITSSEKADKEKRYCEFDLYSVPYPGIYQLGVKCEYFANI